MGLQVALQLSASLMCFSWLVKAATGSKKNQLLLVSFDGFRWDYLAKARTPNFEQFMSDGVHVTKVKNAFTTLTFPNHWTLVTGQYPENHDIVSNSMYDSAYGETFSMSTVDEKWWNTTEPIWVTAMRSNLTAATYFWPGSEVENHGYRPVHWFKYTDGTPFLTRVNEVIRWLKDEMIDVVTLYFNEPDSTGHSKGPDAPETVQMVEEMDSVLGYLSNQLSATGLADKVNVIIASDHGMTEVNSSSKVIRLYNYVNRTDIQWSYASAIGLILPKEGLLAKVYSALKNAHPNMKVYLKEDVPAELHYMKSRRITPIVIIPDEGWQVTTSTGALTLKGAHGYNNSASSMRSLLVAKGPGFKRGYIKDEIDSVDVYPLMCELLGIVPHAHDGNFSNVKDLLRDLKPTAINGAPARIWLAGLVSVMLLISVNIR